MKGLKISSGAWTKCIVDVFSGRRNVADVTGERRIGGGRIKITSTSKFPRNGGGNGGDITVPTPVQARQGVLVQGSPLPQCASPPYRMRKAAEGVRKSVLI